MLLPRSSPFVFVAGLLVVGACARSEQTGAAGGDSLMAGYWQLPLAEQGEAPAAWTELERSLRPEDCAQCHPQQYSDWTTALHSKAFSAGFVGQLLNYEFDEAAVCMECHAPLAEQRFAFEMARVGGVGHDPAGQGLAASGNGCAGCHVREQRRFGPPKRGTGATGQSKTD
jgi:hypothetical protein